MYQQPHEQSYIYVPQGEPVPVPPMRAEVPRLPQWLVPLSLAGLVGVALSIAGFATEHAHPRSAVRHWHAAMSAGDVATLRTDERLGMRAWVAHLVRELGEREYLRVLGIFDHARELGQQEFTRLCALAVSGGQAAFEALPPEQQTAITSQSHNEWVFESGFAQVPEAGVAGSWGALSGAPASDLLLRLGTSALSADEQTLLGGRAATDPAVVADPMLASLAARRTAEGETMYRRLRDQVWAAGGRAFRHEHRSTQQEIDARSRNHFVLAHSYSSLSPADQTRLGSADALTDTTGVVAERLGRQLLPIAEQREIASLTRAGFVTDHRPWSEATGTRLAHERLRGEFAGSRFHNESLSVSGVGGRDLVRRQRAHAEIYWDQVGIGLSFLPAAIELRWGAGIALGAHRITQPTLVS